MAENPLVDHPRYETIRPLSRGLVIFVLLARDKERKEEVVIKFFQRGRYIKECVEREIMNHKNLRHHHIIQFREVFLTRDYLAVVTDYATGGDLLKFVQRMGSIPEDMARWIFQQLIIGLDYLHQMGVVNRSLRLENILLNDGTWPLAKIRNLRLSTEEVFDSVSDTLLVVPNHIAPEIMLGDYSANGTYDSKKTDIWSCGVLLYAILVGRNPFHSADEGGLQNTLAMHRRILSADYNIPPGKMSEECADLIRRILVTDPQTRADISEIQQHQWFQKKLPRRALSMNDYLGTQDVQSETEIKAILEQA